jgi:hypothetical protein
MPVRRQHYLHRAHAHVSEQRRRPRAAVIYECDRTTRDVRHTVLRVRDKEESGLRRAGIVANHVGAGGSRIVDLLPADRRRVLGDDSGVYRRQRLVGHGGCRPRYRLRGLNDTPRRGLRRRRVCRRVRGRQVPGTSPSALLRACRYRDEQSRHGADRHSYCTHSLLPH